ncbi:hypothetical protein [Actinoplanes subtropicus]|uniref:hypothetical protein n=1 Tax=Actinoplanes subtropicus TaxID=543632 RepID=UPI0004C2D07A|nr:hypothetical protein [Actinoplanes subtropicus]
MTAFPNPYTDQEWQERLQAATAATLRKQAEKRDERRKRQAHRDAGLQQRHSGKLARIDAAAAVDTTGTRCRYLVSETPPEPCSNERLPGAELCRPHLQHAAALARRLGLAAP